MPLLRPLYDLEPEFLSSSIEALVPKQFNDRNGWSFLRRRDWKVFDFLHSRTALVPKKTVVTAYKVVDVSDPRLISSEEMVRWYGRRPEEEPVSPDLLALVLAQSLAFANPKICLATLSVREQCMFCFIPKGLCDGTFPYTNQIYVYQFGSSIPRFNFGDVYLVTSRPAPLEGP